MKKHLKATLIFLGVLAAIGIIGIISFYIGKGVYYLARLEGCVVGYISTGLACIIILFAITMLYLHILEVIEDKD